MPDQPTEETTHVAAEATKGDRLLEDLQRCLPEGYELVGDLIQRLRPDGRPQPVSGPVFARSHAFRADRSGRCLEVAFRAFDGVWQSAVFPMRDILKAPGQVVAELVDRGLDLRGRPQEVCDLLRAMRVDHQRLAIEMTGWVDEAYDSFISPSGEVLTTPGANGPHQVLFCGTARVAGQPLLDGQRKATVQDWRKNVVGALPGDAVMLGLCAAITPVLLPVTGKPSFLLHIHGNEGAARISRAVGASVWAQPGQLQLNWSDPLPQILAEIKIARNGLVLLAGYEPRHYRKLPAIAEAMAAIDAFGPARTVILSTGMAPLIGGDGRAPVGQDYRNIIDVDTRSWPAEDSDEIMAAAAKYAGAYGPELVRSLIAWRVGERREYLGCRQDDILDSVTEKGKVPLDSETERVGRAFGAMHAAAALVGRLSADPLIDARKALPLEEQSKALFRRLLNTWLATHRGVLSAQDRALLGRAASEIRGLLREEALTSLDAEHGTVPVSQVGWHDDKAVYLTSPTLATIARADGATMERLIDLLQAQDLLKPGGERGFQYKLPSRIPGRPRAYRLSRDILRFAAAREGE